MNSDWLRDVARFFLDGLTLRQLIHMLIILIILIIITPTSAKEWINAHNPEILPPYWMYYALLFCISYVVRGLISGVKKWLIDIRRSLSVASRKRKISTVVSCLTEEQLTFFILPMHERTQMVITDLVYPEVAELLELGVLLPDPSDWGDGYLAFRIDNDYWREITLRWNPDDSSVRPAD